MDEFVALPLHDNEVLTFEGNKQSARVIIVECIKLICIVLSSIFHYYLLECIKQYKTVQSVNDIELEQPILYGKGFPNLLQQEAD